MIGLTNTEILTHHHEFLGWTYIFTGGFSLAYFVHPWDIGVGVNVDSLICARTSARRWSGRGSVSVKIVENV